MAEPYSPIESDHLVADHEERRAEDRRRCERCRKQAWGAAVEAWTGANVAQCPQSREFLAVARSRWPVELEWLRPIIERMGRVVLYPIV